MYLIQCFQRDTFNHGYNFLITKRGRRKENIAANIIMRLK